MREEEDEKRSRQMDTYHEGNISSSSLVRCGKTKNDINASATLL